MNWPRLLFNMYRKGSKYMFLDGWFRIQLKMMRENNRPTTRLSYLGSYGIGIGHPILPLASPKFIMAFLYLLQVVVQQLNFVEKNFSSMASYDRDSDTFTAGKL